MNEAQTISALPKIDNVSIFESLLDAWTTKLTLNTRQVNVLRKLRNVEGNTLAVIGPAGTGKTRLLSVMIYLCTTVGHRILVCAPDDAALDNLAILTSSEDLGVMENKKLLWLRAASAYEEYIQRASSEDADGATTEDEEAFQDDIDQEGSQGHAPNEWFYELMHGAGSWRSRPTEIPYRMTMSGLIQGLMHEDREEAQRAYEKELREMGPSEDILSADDRNPSKQYADAYEAYTQPKANVSAEGKRSLFELRASMKKRVYKSLDVVFASLNHSGSQEFEKSGFSPTMIIVDNAGHARMPALFIPITRFTSWNVLILAGDTKQLLPTILARKASEVVKSSEESPLHRLEISQTNVMTLNEQYRIAPSVASFPSRHVYGNQIQWHPSASKDNGIRQRVREVAKQYGIKEDSEYFFLDVPWQSRPKPDKTSPQVYPHADVINDVLDRLHATGVPAEAILILSFFEINLSLLRQRIRTKSDGSPKYFKILTPDAYQSNEANVVIVDFGLASTSAPRISRSMKDWRRLNVALTRARDGLVLVGPMALLAGTMEQYEDPVVNTMFHMCSDAWERSLIVHLPYVCSIHPPAGREREQLGTRVNLTAAQVSDKSRNINLLRTILKKGRALQNIQIEAAAKAMEQAVPVTTGLPTLEEVKAAREAKLKSGEVAVAEAHPRQPPSIESEDEEGDTALEKKISGLSLGL
ncbi:MAG: hypothetical protein Q9170_003026 [Blastenia crenularia]